MAEPMRALTVIRPWDEPIAASVKTVENRSWKPPKIVRGELIAIHAGKKYDADAADVIRGLGFECMPRSRSNLHRAGAVVGVVRVVGCIWKGGHEKYTEGGDHPGHAARWFFGPYGWVLEEAVALGCPVYCRGAQGVWKLPLRVERAVRQQVDEVRDA